MKKIYSGKTKDVYQSSEGTIQLLFKDTLTGEKGVFDPGSNQVGLELEGAGYYGLAMSQYFFELFETQGIPTHYLASNLDANTMDVKKVEFLGKGLEVIYRRIATGSFIRRYGDYYQAGQPLNHYIEFTLKNDEKGDPFISQELLELFGILKIGEYEQIKQLTRRIAMIVYQVLEAKGLTLYDLKLEFGRDEQGNLMLIDEISGGNMRVYRGTQSLTPIELSKICLKSSSA